VSVDGEHGFHIKPDDVDDLTQKLREFFAQPAERRQEMGLAARQHVLDHFTWKHSLDALDGALRAAVVAR
jgi:glycosyltransferase involved in cell wall biosynthesis